MAEMMYAKSLSKQVLAIDLADIICWQAAYMVLGVQSMSEATTLCIADVSH